MDSIFYNVLNKPISLWGDFAVLDLRDWIGEIELPFPPSANRYWRINPYGKPYRSETAKDYIQQVRYQFIGMFALTDKPLMVALHFYFARRQGDLDNRQKIVLDALQGILYRDDQQITWLRDVVRSHDKHHPRVIVRWRELDRFYL